MSLRFLVLDAYDAEGRRALGRVGATEAGQLYERTLRSLEPDATVVVRPFGERGFELGGGDEPSAFDGVVWTGSNLTVHRDTPAVRDQLALVRATFDAGVPAFGSCWALHVAITAAGGRCAQNPKGREFGLARKVTLSDRGRGHPLFADKPPCFDAFASHEDHVVEPGPSAEILAGNDFSPVQAAVVRAGRGEFWAVQYHPEYELVDVADLGKLRAPQLVEQGFFRDAGDAAAYLSDLRALHADPDRRDLAYRLAVGDDVRVPAVRTVEARNWIDRLVKPRAGGASPRAGRSSGARPRE